MTGLIKGIDISAIQGHVDFAACAAAGIQFVICRCGVGNGGKDSFYDTNMVKAQAAGLKTAAYHFIYPLPTTPSQPLRDPVKQAQQHANWAGNAPVVCCDLEWPTPDAWAKWGCSAKQIIQWTVTYLQAYESITGIRPVVYTYPFFAKSINLPASFAQTYKLWIASYAPSPTIPAPWTDWVIWQDSSGPYHLPTTGVVVDTNKAKDLSLWDTPVVVAPVVPVVAPVPDPVIAPAIDTVVPTVNPVPAPTPQTNFIVSIWQLLQGLFKR